jgi:hypothetical protein
MITNCYNVVVATFPDGVVGCVTHDEESIQRADQVVRLEEGRPA